MLFCRFIIILNLYGHTGLVVYVAILSVSGQCSFKFKNGVPSFRSAQHAIQIKLQLAYEIMTFTI